MRKIAEKFGFIAFVLGVVSFAAFLGIYAIATDTSGLVTYQLILLAIQVFFLVLVAKYPNETITF